MALLRGGFLLLVFALALRLFFLQVVNHAQYATLSEGQSSQDITTTALRGGIYDRYGQPLAISRPTDEVIADDFQITQPAKEAAALAPLLGMSPTKLTALLSQKNGYVVVTNSLGLTAGHKVSQLYFPGILVRNESSREYPQGTVAESVVGGVNQNGAGSAGIEYGYQSVLAGTDGVTRSFVSQSGVGLPGAHTTVIKKAVPGVGLELTLDSALQYVTEHDLATMLKSVGAVSGQAVVMDVHTGEILADASLVNTKTNPGVLGPIPSWQRSIGVPGIEQTINNLPFTQAYEPGSVFKVVTFSAALNKGAIAPSTMFAVPNSVFVGTRKFHDAEVHGLLHMTATDILAQSSNVGTYEVGRTVGESGILSQVNLLGFGQRTAVNYPGETAGLIVNANQWYPADAVALPIGQVDAVPAIQVLDAYNAIANGGVFVEPKLVRGYVYGNGKLRATPASSEHRVLTPSVDSEMVHMLEQVVLAGTGTNAIIPGYSVAGKTGTASIPYPGKDLLLSGAYNATFTGFAPANNPTFSMIVVIERPQSTIFGGETAAPVFQEVMSYALRHYGIPSDGTSQKAQKGSVSISSDVT